MDYVASRWQKGRQSAQSYPRVFYVILAIRLISATGGGLYWPFLLVYLRQELQIDVTTASALLTLHMLAGMLSLSISGVLMDLFGRKRVMLFALGALSLVLAAMAFARSLSAWMLLMPMAGMLSPIFQVGAETVIADLVEPERRSRAYALARIAINIGWMTGPVIGSILVKTSYTPIFLSCAAAMAICAGLGAFAIVETLPKTDADDPAFPSPRRQYGYGAVVRDHRFMLFSAIFMLFPIAQMMLGTLGGDYMKTQFDLAESYFGIMMSVNGAIVVLFEFPITSFVRRFPTGRVLSVGISLYAIAMLIMGNASVFAAFLLTIVVATFGEIIISPNSLTYASNLAPEALRGRYMGLFGLIRQGGYAIGPLLGGLLSDQIAPIAIWYGGALLCVVAAIGFALLPTRKMRQSALPDITSCQC